ncbi:hypothetical protein L211DRAFT_854211 [Terfezia boudieri ATCC MYA-4762]|uniref:DNA 3'-5' helicase n=1 Tax=Terfezia boudieri ATCC MYA-4762 TaxID=1051890 RepID=A0A3N4LA37_9PEZI|nr:hypothetical protein L211DRAFT_854211 [Terfezia boudieri ATCC MYA-4762]
MSVVLLVGDRAGCGRMTTGTASDKNPGAAMAGESEQENELMLLRVTSKNLFIQSLQLESEVQPLVGIRAKISEIALHMAIARGVPLRVIPWQVEAAARFIEGRDQMVISKTGDGKTFCFLLASLCSLDRTIVVLTPLISLEDCHMATARKYGLKAVAINTKSVADDPTIIVKAISGVYHLIFTCPEMLEVNHPMFQQLSKSKIFQKRLLGFVIDEVHLCH